MKMKDLEKLVKETIKFEEFKGNEVKYEVRLIEKFGDIKANSFKELYKNFSEEYYGEVNGDTEVRYEDGEMVITVEYIYRTWNIEQQKFEHENKQYDWYVYVDMITVANQWCETRKSL